MKSLSLTGPVVLACNKEVETTGSLGLDGQKYSGMNELLVR